MQKRLAAGITHDPAFLATIYMRLREKQINHYPLEFGHLRQHISHRLLWINYPGMLSGT